MENPPDTEPAGSRTAMHRRKRGGLFIPAALIAIFTALIMAAACAPLYTPNAVHTTLARNHGTVQGAVTYGAGEFNGNLDVTPVNNVSVIGSYAFEPWSGEAPGSKPPFDSTAGHVAHNFWEAGLGYSMMFDSTQADVIAGFGMGHATAFWPKDSSAPAGVYQQPLVTGDPLAGIYRVDGDYRRVFLQTTLTRTSTEAMKDTPGNYGLALRTSYVWFTDLARLDRSTLHPRALFFDPVAFVRAGNRNFQIELQGGFSVKVPLNDDQLRVQVIFIELGVHAVLDGLW